MDTYHVFGFDVESDISLPELPPAQSTVRPVVSIRLGQVEKFQANVDGTQHYASHDQILFSYDGVARFRVTKGREIVVDAQSPADAMLLRVCLLGPALGALLHQRGVLVLHASAVYVGGAASVFLGGSGWGKSTLAAFLRARGNGLLSDDIVAVEASEDPRILPGIPQMKLWPPSVEALGIDPATLPRLHPGLEKRAYKVDDRLQIGPVGLGRVYVLDTGDRLAVERLGRAEAFSELVRHTYLLKYLASSGTSVAHFRQCADLVKAVPIYRIVRPPVLAQLGEVAELLEGHSHQ